MRLKTDFYKAQAILSRGSQNVLFFFSKKSNSHPKNNRRRDNDRWKNDRRGFRNKKRQNLF